MKKYNHIKHINLGRPLIQYYNRINGLIVTSNHIFWFKDPNINKRCCLICGIIYTAEDFKDQFDYYVSRQEELNKTKKWDTVSKHVRDEDIEENDYKNLKLTTFDIIADPGFNARIGKSYNSYRSYGGDSGAR
jgi:hypothetical protein